MKWTVHGRTELYSSPWVALHLIEVEVPGGRRYEHHGISGPDAAGAIVSDPDRGVLMIWRHRFLADEWGWEIPGGMVEAGEDPAAAARRECIEESGWAPGPLRLLQWFSPNAGQSSQRFWIYASDSASLVGEPCAEEAERVEWVPLDRLAELVAGNQVVDGLSVIAVLHALSAQR